MLHMGQGSGLLRSKTGDHNGIGGGETRDLKFEDKHWIELYFITAKFSV